MRNLKPKSGYVFTQAAEISLEQRVYADELYLAVNDSFENWKEITIKEAVALQEELTKRMEETTT